MNSKDRNELIGKIKDYYESNKETSLYFYPLAVLYYQNNEKEKAYQTLLDGLQHYPRYVLALIKIAQILIEDNKFKAALAYLETAVSIQKNSTKALEYLAFAYEKLGDYEKSIKTYEKILEIEPDNEQVKSKIIELAPLIKPSEEALDSIIENLEPEEDTIESKQTLEELAETIQQNDNNSTIEIDDIPQINLENDEIEITENDKEQDKETKEHENEEDDEENISSITLARLYEKQGYIEDAIKTYKHILEKEPDNVEALEELKKLEKMEHK